jgi:hypothetical protein
MRDFALGFFSSKKYVLPAPRPEMRIPPMIIPGTRGADILGVKKEKKWVGLARLGRRPRYRQILKLRTGVLNFSIFGNDVKYHKLSTPE